jgi:predicted transcriptional regulator
MVRKSAQFAQAKELRMRGFTYIEIAKIVNVSKSTISQWFSGEVWSKKVRADNRTRAARDNGKRISLLNTARSTQRRKQYLEAEASAVTEFRHYKSNPLFIAGLSLYLSQGDTSSSQLIRISTTKQEVHRVFMGFLTEFLGVPREKIRFWLLLYPSLDPEKCSRIWAKKLKLSVAMFHKYQVIQPKTIKPTLHYGVGNTIIGSTVLKKKLMKWIELIQMEL